MKKKYLILIIILIFIVSVAVRYWPVYHKGFSYSIEADNLILARNLSLTGEYKIDNEKNVVLSSKIVKEEGIQSKFGNKLTPILYGKIFGLFGFDRNIPLYVSLILYGIVSVLLFLLVLKLFNIWVALIFSFIEVFSPLVVQYATRAGSYEWAVLFLVIALLFYLWKEKPNLFRLFLAGLFFALASLTRNSFLILPFVFLIYDFWKNKSFKRIIVLVLPLFVLWGIYLGPSFIEKGEIDNAYINSQETTSAYMHIFPDPYTWHFERDVYVESVQGITNYDYSQFLLKYGYPISFKNKVLMYWASIKSYPKGLFAQTTIGGPFLVFFMILGGVCLFGKKKELLQLFVLWAGFLYFFLIVLKSNHWGHFMVLQLPLFLLISLGIYWMIQFILKQNFRNYFKYFFILGFIFILFLHLVQSDKWMLHERYENSNMEQTLVLVEAVKGKKQNIDKGIDIIAVGLQNPAASVLNYYTDFSCVYFDANTVKKLLKENKLQWAFDQFGVTKIIGYDKELTDEIVKVTKIEVIDNPQ
jgi:hypothetical protein